MFNGSIQHRLIQICTFYAPISIQTILRKISAEMTAEVTMTTRTVQTHLEFLIEKRNTNEAETTALSQSLVTLKMELDNW